MDLLKLVRAAWRKWHSKENRRYTPPHPETTHTVTGVCRGPNDELTVEYAETLSPEWQVDDVGYP